MIHCMRGKNMYCSKCGKELRGDMQFCWNCGNKIEIIEEEIKPIEEKETETVEPEKEILEKTFCWNCKEEIDKKMDVCPKCGTTVKLVISKNPGIAAVLSFLIPGLGHAYNGKITIGVIFPIVEILLIIISTYLIRTSKIIDGFILLILVTGIWIYGVYDSYKTAEKINNERYK